MAENFIWNTTTEFFYLKLLCSFAIISQIRETRQSDKSPVERNTQQRRIEVRYMAFVFHLHQESKALKTDGLLIKNISYLPWFLHWLAWKKCFKPFCRLPSVTTACIWNIYSASKICGSHYDCPLTDCNE